MAFERLQHGADRSGVQALCNGAHCQCAVPDAADVPAAAGAAAEAVEQGPWHVAAVPSVELAHAASAAGLGLEDDLKSVAYQPEPFNWKPAAVSCFLNAGAPQDGQSVSGASLNFCRTSLAWPQDSQR